MFKKLIHEATMNDLQTLNKVLEILNSKQKLKTIEIIKEVINKSSKVQKLFFDGFQISNSKEVNNYIELAEKLNFSFNYHIFSGTKVVFSSDRFDRTIFTICY